ncbi:hypothetical protein H8356DRAFT_1337166 [Neocallimastix lanati (nom. inval.)]|nr:hypothetical protein H8356DRAFT_1337166 [Neocallimastix sp. JGI-2020a]
MKQNISSNTVKENVGGPGSDNNNELNDINKNNIINKKIDRNIKFYSSSNDN